MKKIINKIDRSSLDLPIFFKKFLGTPTEEDKNNVGIYIVSNTNKGGDFTNAQKDWIAVYDRNKSAWKFIKPRNIKTQMYCLDDKSWYHYDTSQWVKIGTTIVPTEPVNNNLSNIPISIIDDYLYIDTSEGTKPTSVVPAPLYKTEYKITIKSLTENTQITNIMKCKYLGDDGTQNGMYPLCINGNAEWSIDGIDVNDLNGTYLCKNHPFMMEFKNGAITKVTNINSNFLVYCRKSQQLISVYMFDMYKRSDGTKIDGLRYMQALTIGNRANSRNQVTTKILDIDTDGATIPEYVEVCYPWAKETDPNKLDKYWADRGFYITNDHKLGSNWELVTINRTITQDEEDSKSLVLHNYIMDDCAVLLSCEGVDQYEGLDFSINRDTKTITWNGLGLDTIVKKDDHFVITYVTADKDR